MNLADKFTNPQKQTIRSHYWDNIKGILIILVVLGHFLWEYWGLGYVDFILKFIYLFHMPAFAFVSGFLSKSENAKSIEKIKRLILMYLIFNTAIMILNNFLFDSYFTFLSPYYSYWFIISLICWRIAIKYLENINHILFIATATAFLIGFWSDVTNVLAISRTIVFFPFFLIGYKQYSETHAVSITSRKALDYIKGVLLIIIAIIASYYIIYGTDILTQSNLVMDTYTSVTDFIARFIVFDVSLFIIGGLTLLTENRYVPLITRFGKNSMAIYVLHRPITFLFVLLFPKETYSNLVLMFSLLATAITVVLLGLDIVSVKLNKVIDKISYLLMHGFSNISHERKKLWSILASLSFVLFLSQPIISALISNKAIGDEGGNKSEYPIHRVVTEVQEDKIRNSLTLAFVGDLILLQGQVENAYNDVTMEYDFDPIFHHAKKYLEAADFAIGIFEGPMAGEEVGYSTSNYDDGIPLALNFPDSFARSVKSSGIDLVSTANNHLLDKGIEAAFRTQEILNKEGLLQTGTYRTAEEKKNIQIVDINGVRIAIVSYTFNSNGYSDKYFIEENPNITSLIVDPKSKYFGKIKENVLNDLERINEMSNPPDLIAVIPHMGTQFIHETDNYQRTWNKIFIDAGADIVLGDHSHAVQPIEYETVISDDGKERTALIVNCPGNFANSYTEFNGDATSIIELYIDKSSKMINGAAVIPMYTQSPSNGNFRALPIYSILTDEELKNEISVLEMKRVSEVQKLVTSVMLGSELTLDQAQERYYLFPDGYARQSSSPLTNLDSYQESEIMKVISASDEITFIGDSITKGSRNGGYSWFEPLAAAFPQKTIHNASWDSGTTKTLLDNFDQIVEHDSDLYVIAIGTNDVRYRDKKKCAMDSESYIKNIDTLITKIRERNINARFILVAPWLALANDPFSKLTITERDQMLKEYGDALEIYSDQNGLIFSNPNIRISDVFSIKPESNYLIDHIHPNASSGIRLYSEAFISYIP